VLNADGTRARLQWDPITDDWLTPGGLEGKFTLTLKNGQDPDIVYDVLANPFQVSLRIVDVAGYTVFEGQTGGGDVLPDSDFESYVFNAAPGSFTGIPSDLNLSFSGRGTVSVSDAGSATWSENGTFTLRINHGARPFSDLANLPLHLRRLVSDEFTVFKGQTGGGDAMPYTDPGTYGFAILPWTLPSDMELSCTSRGAIFVDNPGTAAWTEDGTFTMRINPAAGPYCDVNNLGLHLRQLVSDDFTVFRGQTGGGDAIPYTDPGTYGFAILPWTLPSDMELSCTSRGAISVGNPGSAVWNENGTFTMRINPASGPYCDIANIGLHLRQLVSDGFTVFRGQTGGGEAIPPSDVATYGFAILPWSMPGDLVLGCTNRGAIFVDDPGSAAWNEDGTFTMRVNPGTGPYCDIDNLGLHLRQVIPDPLTIPYNEVVGSVVLQVDGDPGLWDWTNWDDGLPISILTASNTYGSADFTVSWLADGLHEGEYGCGHMTIALSDGSAPSSTLCLDIEILSSTCCVGRVGNANGLGTYPQEVTISDIQLLVTAKFISSLPCEQNLPCLSEADVNQSGGANPKCSDVTISDIQTLVNHLFIAGPANAPLKLCL
jgi:hypothetical protein